MFLRSVESRPKCDMLRNSNINHLSMSPMQNRFSLNDYKKVTVFLLSNYKDKTPKSFLNRIVFRVSNSIREESSLSSSQMVGTLFVEKSWLLEICS